MDGNKVAIYEVKVNDQVRKAIDLIALKNYLEAKKANFSVLNIDVSRIDNDQRLVDYIAKAAIDTLGEIEYTIDLELGLIEEQEPVEEIKPKVKPQPEKLKVSEPTKEEDILSDSEDDEDDDSEIVL